MTRAAFYIELARADDALPIAELSRDAIEYGLGWRWTRERVLRCIRDPATNVIVARAATSIVRPATPAVRSASSLSRLPTPVARNVAGFAIISYQDRNEDETAHLLLFAVAPSHRRERIGSTLLAWLEATTLTAGIGVISLEARLTNREARAFYHHHGYREGVQVRAMYRGVEDGIRIAKDLWANAPDASRTST